MIPAIIHQIWIGPEPTDQVREWMATWPSFHPAWEYRLWDEAEIAKFGLKNQDLWNRAEEISPYAVEQFRSDVARYEILSRFGGVYVDADFECQHAIDQLLDNEAFVVWVAKHWLNNAIFGAIPEHPLLEELISELPANVARFGPTDGNTKKSGPQFMTPIALRHHLTCLPEEMFFPYLWNQLERGSESFPNSWAVHHWLNRRRSANNRATRARQAHHLRG